MNIDYVKQFLAHHTTCVVTTAGPQGQPQAATVGFSVDEEMKVLIATNQKTRKAANLSANNKVAIVIGFEGPKTVQLEGLAEVINQTEYQERINLHFEKAPGAKKFAGEEGQQYYLITPTWLRFTDYTHPDQIFETRSFI